MTIKLKMLKHLDKQAFMRNCTPFPYKEKEYNELL